MDTKGVVVELGSTLDVHKIRLAHDNCQLCGDLGLVCLQNCVLVG